jgi:vacuolar-type H+-ATPase subunit H
MKKIKLIATITACVIAMFCNNGCVTTEKEVKEPTITPASEKTEVIIEDIEVIKRNDTTGTLNAAQEAARNLIADAKRQSVELTRDAKNIYELKKIEAENNAAKIIADARVQATKEKAALLKSYTNEQKKVTDKKVKEIVYKSQANLVKSEKVLQQKMEKILKGKKVQTDKIADKVIQSAKKSASDITKASFQKVKKIKKEAEKILADANKYAKDKKDEADKYLTKKMVEADKAVEHFIEKMKKESIKKQKTKEEKTAEKIVKSILGAIPEDDYSTFTANFTTDLKARFTKKKFMATNKVLKEKLGPCTKTEYLGFLKKGPLTMYLWKANFAKAPKDNEMVIRLTLGDLDKKLQIFAFDISMM